MKKLILTIQFAALLASVNVQAQWVQVNAPYGDAVWSLAVNGTNLFAGTNDGVFRVSRDGSNWRATSIGLSDSNVQAIAVRGTSIFAGTYNGVLVTTNNGENWMSSNVGLTNSDVRCLATSDTNVFVGTDSGVFISTNSGGEWKADNNGSKNIIWSLVVSGTSLIAGTSEGVFLSSNNGANWTAANNGLPPNINTRSLVVDGSEIFAGTDDGIFRSNDSGRSWVSASTGIDHMMIQSLIVNGGNLYASDGDVFYSSDSGKTWNAVNNGVTATVYSFALIDSTLFAGGGGAPGGGIFQKSNNDSLWSVVDNGLTSVDISTLFGANGTIFAGTYDGIFASTDSGMNWIASSNGLPSGIQINAFAMIDNNIFAGAEGNATGAGVYASTDFGNSWTQKNNGLTNAHISALIVLGTKLIAGTNNGSVFLSTDQGSSWTVTQSSIFDIEAFAINGAKLFACGGGEFFISMDSGVTWVKQSSIGGSALTFFEGDLYMGGNGMNRSSNDGLQWSDISSGFPTIKGYWSSHYITSFAEIGNSLFASENGGIFFYTLATPWSNVSNDLPSDISFQSLLISGSTLFAGSTESNSGLWRRPLSDFGISSVAETPVAAQPQIQSFPNPFTQSTEITFTTPAAGYAEISIVNAIGAEVARLYAGELEAGNHSFTWNATGGTPALQGNYWCVVRMNGSVESLPMVLVP